MMCLIWREPRENLEILKWFGLEDSRKLPAFVTFTFEGEELLSECHAIANDSPEIVFRSIEQVLNAIQASVMKCGRDSATLFSDIRAWMRRIRIIGGIKRFVGAVATFRGVSGL